LTWFCPLPWKRKGITKWCLSLNFNSVVPLSLFENGIYDLSMLVGKASWTTKEGFKISKLCFLLFVYASHSPSPQSLLHWFKEKNNTEDCSFFREKSEKPQHVDSKSYISFDTTCHISKSLHRLCNSKSKI